MNKRIIFLSIIIVALLIIAIPFWRTDIKSVKEAREEVKKITSKYKVQLIKWFPFSEENALKEWEEKVFKGKVVYKIEKDKDLSYVKAESSGTASALYYKVNMDAKRRHPVIGWKWRAGKFPEKNFEESLDKEKEDDFAARVYVIFPAKFLLNSRVLEYVWAEKLPVGSSGTSPYSKNIKLLVLRSGPAKDGEWSFEERNIVEDYLKLFGRSPEYDIGAIAFMTNTEHTRTSADAVYDDIKIGYNEDLAGTGKGDDSL